MNRRRWARIAVLLLYGLLSCGRQAPEPPAETPAYTLPATEYTVFASEPSAPAVTFAAVTAEAGIDFRHETGAFGQKWMPESMGSGCILFDYDADGHLDILLIDGTYWPGRESPGPAPTPRLYRNLGNGQFVEVTEAVGLDISFYGMGGAAGDYNGNGYLDLYLTSVGDNLLLRNEQGRFVDVTSEAGVAGGRWETESGTEYPEWSVSAAWVDVDLDGWIDLFVANYVRWSPQTDLFTTIDGVNKSYATPQQYDGSSCRLYRNLGDGSFADVTVQAGVYNPRGKSLGVAVADFNDDGFPELVVANDTQPNFLYWNQGDGTFVDIGLRAGIAYDEGGRARAGMGVDVAALGNDRSLAIAIGNFSREAVALFRQSRQDLFIDVAGGWGLATPTLLPLTFGLVFFDYDLDGNQDLALANGHLEPEVNKVQQEIHYAQRPQLFWNDGQGRFHETSATAGPAFTRPVVGRGLAYGDLNNNGRLDLVLTTNDGSPVIMRNDGPAGHAVRVRLQGKFPNRYALGAMVAAVSGETEQRAMVRTGSSYLSQSELTLTFGLGARRRVDRLIVRWPAGRSDNFAELDAGFTYVIDEEQGIIARLPFRENQ